MNPNGLYEGNCGLRVGNNYYGNGLCQATRGWPGSYCQNSWNVKTTFCDGNVCAFDCQAYGQDGGYCEQNKCFCFKQVFKAKTDENLVEGPENSENSVLL